MDKKVFLETIMEGIERGIEESKEKIVHGNITLDLTGMGAIGIYMLIKQNEKIIEELEYIRNIAIHIDSKIYP